MTPNAEFAFDVVPDWVGSRSVPALCFFEDIAPSVLKLDIFPEEVQAAFTHNTTFAPTQRVHIVEAHALGQFPAEFKIDVYQPPPEAVCSAKFSGEPRVAYGLLKPLDTSALPPLPPPELLHPNQRVSGLADQGDELQVSVAARGSLSAGKRF